MALEDGYNGDEAEYIEGNYAYGYPIITFNTASGEVSKQCENNIWVEDMTEAEWNSALATEKASLKLKYSIVEI